MKGSFPALFLTIRAPVRSLLTLRLRLPAVSWTQSSRVPHHFQLLARNSPPAKLLQTLPCIKEWRSHCYRSDNVSVYKINMHLISMFKTSIFKSSRICIYLHVINFTESLMRRIVQGCSPYVIPPFQTNQSIASLLPAAALPSHAQPWLGA